MHTGRSATHAGGGSNPCRSGRRRLFCVGICCCVCRIRLGVITFAALVLANRRLSKFRRPDKVWQSWTRVPVPASRHGSRTSEAAKEPAPERIWSLLPRRRVVNFACPSILLESSTSPRVGCGSSRTAPGAMVGARIELPRSIDPNAPPENCLHRRQQIRSSRPLAGTEVSPIVPKNWPRAFAVLRTAPGANIDHTGLPDP